jgi:hypothetical protein
MGKKKHGKRNYRKARERNISIRGVRRNPPDLKKLSQALVALAMAQAEAEAQAEHDKRNPTVPPETAADSQENAHGA